MPSQSISLGMTWGFDKTLITNDVGRDQGQPREDISIKTYYSTNHFDAISCAVLFRQSLSHAHMLFSQL